MKTAGVYFPSLDGIRAFACLSVFAGHMFDYINNRTLSNAAEIWCYEHFINGAGAMGVSLFFVLSGFLITYLLLREKNARNTIHLGFFYMKRILRIWPLFFLVAIAGFFIVPLVTGNYDAEITKQHLPWFLTFTNNFDRILTGFTGIGNDSLGVLWSVAVEEQFYLLWPLVILICSKRLFPFVAGAVIILSAVFRYRYAGDADVIFYHSLSVSGDLAMGGLAAWLGFYSGAFRDMLHSLRTPVRFLLLMLITLIIFHHRFLLDPGVISVGGRFLLCLCFAWLICDQCFARKEHLSLSKLTYFTRIGIISYGFYCYHMFVIMALQKFNLVMGYTVISTLLFYAEFAVAFLITLGISVASYYLLEKQFLKLRPRFDAMRIEPVKR